MILHHDHLEAIGQHTAFDDLFELGALPVSRRGRQSHGGKRERLQRHAGQLGWFAMDSRDERILYNAGAVAVTRD